MITISIVQGKGKIFTINARGHAEFNPGNDIVCSAVSALLQSLQGVLMMSSGKYEMEAKSGYMYLHYKGHLAETRMLLVGLLRIEKAYPDNVCVEYGGKFLP